MVENLGQMREKRSVGPLVQLLPLLPRQGAREGLRQRGAHQVVGAELLQHAVVLVLVNLPLVVDPGGERGGKDVRHSPQTQTALRGP